MWSPYYITHVHRLERVQRRFLRLIAFKLHIPRELISYTDISNLLNIASLESRRTYINILVLFKVTNGIIDCPELLPSISLRVPQRHTRSEDLCVLHVGIHRTNYGFNSPLVRMCRQYNVYCSDLDVFSMPLGVFVNTLRRRLLSCVT